MTSLNRLSELRPADAAGSYLAAQRAAIDAPKDGSPAAALPEDSVSLSQEALDAHAAGLARFAEDAASSLIQRFAGALFGDGVDTSGIRFASSEIDVSSGFTLGAVANDGGGAAALSLADSAHFIGQGEIVTADGQRFGFQIEIQYDAQVSAAAAAPGQPAAGDNALADAPAGAQAGGPTPLQLLTGRQLPEIEYPGTLEDLFKVLGRDVGAQISGDGDNAGGLFSLRLLRLVQTAALLAPRAATDSAVARPDAYSASLQPDPAARAAA